MKQLVLEKSLHDVLVNEYPDIIREIYLRSATIGVGVSKLVFLLEEEDIHDLVDITNEVD